MDKQTLITWHEILRSENTRLWAERDRLHSKMLELEEKILELKLELEAWKIYASKLEKGLGETE